MCKSLNVAVLYIYICCFISKIAFSYRWSVTEISSDRYFTITILTVWGHLTFKWQQGSVVVELDGPRSIARPPEPSIRRKDLGDISYRIRIRALLSQISLPR